MTRLFLSTVALLACLAVPARPEVLPPSRASAPLTLLQINDVYTIGTLDGGKAGGLARVATMKKQLQSPGRTVLLVLAGDFLSPSVASSIFEGQQMIDVLNAAGLDIATLGNHEFDFGPQVLRKRMKQAKFQWVISNVLDAATGKPIGGAASTLVRQVGPLKVGFFGLCITSSVIDPDNLRGLKMLDPVQTAGRMVAALKRQGANVIVGITHLNYADDHRIAERFPDVHLIIGGHEHVPITSTVNRTLISKAGMNARYVARIDLNRPPGSSLERFFNLVPVTDAVPSDAATARVAAAYDARLEKELDVVIGATKIPLNAREADVRSRETNLGDFIADVMRADVHADAAIMDGGSIRSDHVYPAGPLARRDMQSILPFGDITCKIEVPGATLLAALEHGVSALAQGLGQFPQVSGVRFTVDAAAPPGHRVRDLRVNGQPLAPAKRYTVALTGYALDGGDGYSMFAKGRVLVTPETGRMLVTTMEKYVRRHSPVAPEADGRMKALGGPHGP